MRLKAHLLKHAYPWYKAYLRIRKPIHAGTRVIVQRGNEILLIRHSYGSPAWSLPGGKIDRGETPRHGAVREVREEVGLRIDPERFREHAVIPTTSRYGDGSLYLYHVVLEPAEAAAHTVRIDNGEIIAAQWAMLGTLPADLAQHVDIALAAAGLV